MCFANIRSPVHVCEDQWVSAPACYGARCCSFTALRQHCDLVCAERCNEVSCWFASVDIKQAFDNLGPCALHVCLQFWSVPPLLAGAVLEENLGSNFAAAFQRFNFETPAPFSKAVKQGGTESVELWNLFAHTLLADPALGWELLGYGYASPGYHSLTHLVWADNFLLVSSSKGHL